MPGCGAVQTIPYKCTSMSERPPESSSPSRRAGGRQRFRLGRLESADEYRPLHNVQEQLWNRFAPQKSTEELHRETHPDKVVFHTGAFGQIRQQMDYSYHAHYRKDRLWLHDSIVEDVLMMADTSSLFSSSMTSGGGNGSHTTTSLVAEGPPWLILVVGTRESQKHAVVADLIDAHRLRLSPRFVTVDAGMAQESFVLSSCWLIIYCFHRAMLFFPQ
jgi:hypothetical protein